MVFNPFVFLFLTTLQAATTDYQLISAGVNVTAKIDYVTAVSDTDSGPYEKIGYSWNVNGRQYTDERNLGGQTKLREGDTAPLRVLAKNPQVHERLFSATGTKLRQDLHWMLVQCLVIAVFEIAIWIPAIAERWFVRFGTPAMARVIGKFTREEDEGRAYIIEFEYDAGSRLAHQLSVTEAEYDQYYLNQEFPVLYDPRNPSNHVIYSKLRYIAAPRP
jgi:hypothetical protein